MSNSTGSEDPTDEAEAIWKCLEEAVKRFNKSIDQETLLRPRKKNSKRGPAASERAITHRLALYLELVLRERKRVTDKTLLVVDCEYNRHGGALKTLAAEGELSAIVKKARTRQNDELNDDGYYVFSVAPDIVVHERGHDKRNRLIIEVKKATTLKRLGMTR